MGQKITNHGECPYCMDPLKGVWSRTFYEEDLHEVHCNCCGASWDGEDLSIRAIPSELKLNILKVFDEVLDRGLPYAEEDKPQWFRNAFPESDPTEYNLEVMQKPADRHGIEKKF